MAGRWIGRATGPYLTGNVFFLVGCCFVPGAGPLSGRHPYVGCVPRLRCGQVLWGWERWWKPRYLLEYLLD